MEVVLVIGPEVWERLRQHLLVSDAEQVAFLLAEHRPGDPHQLRLTDLYPVPAEEFEVQGSYHVSLADGVRPKVIKWAWDRGACLIEAHSHQEGMAAFSPSDMAGLDEFVPHVWWRLRGRPYAAMVFAQGGFDALAWVQGPDVASPVTGVLLDGTRRFERPTGLSYAALSLRGQRDR